MLRLKMKPIRGILCLLLSLLWTGCVQHRPRVTTAWRLEAPRPRAWSNHTFESTYVELGEPLPAGETLESGRQATAEPSFPVMPSLRVEPSPSASPAGLVGPIIIPGQIRIPTKLRLTLQAPQQGQVGSGLTYRATIQNTNKTAIENVTVECAFDDALTFPGRTEKKVTQGLGRLLPGETKSIPLTLVGHQTGRHCCRFTVTTNGGESATESVCVELVPRQLDVQVVGPRFRTVGSRAEFTIKLINVSGRNLESIRTQVRADSVLKPKEATTGVTQSDLGLSWTLGDLKPGEGLQLQIEFECMTSAEQACLLVDVAGGNFPDEQVETCIRIAQPHRNLDVRVRDTADSLNVKDQMEYQVTVQNRGRTDLRDVELIGEIPPTVRVVAATIEGGSQSQPVRFKLVGQQILFEPVELPTSNPTLLYRIRVEATRPGNGEFVARVRYSANESPIEIGEPTTVNQAGRSIGPGSSAERGEQPQR